MSEAVATTYCERCGEPAAGSHDCPRPAELRTQLEPPRYCCDCGAKLSVQVLPSGFEAECLRCKRRARFAAAADGAN